MLADKQKDNLRRSKKKISAILSEHPQYSVEDFQFFTDTVILMIDARTIISNAFAFRFYLKGAER